MSGAGKSTLAKEIIKHIKIEKYPVVLVDGDDVRDICGNDLGYSRSDRIKNGWRIVKLCKYLEGQGMTVVCATMSQCHDQQKWARENFNRYFQIYIKADVELLISRDPKGIYGAKIKEKINNVVGFDIEFQEPYKSDLIINAEKELALNAGIVLKTLKKAKWFDDR